MTEKELAQIESELASMTDIRASRLLAEVRRLQSTVNQLDTWVVGAEKERRRADKAEATVDHLAKAIQRHSRGEYTNDHLYAALRPPVQPGSLSGFDEWANDQQVPF